MKEGDIREVRLFVTHIHPNPKHLTFNLNVGISTNIQLNNVNPT